MFARAGGDGERDRQAASLAWGQATRVVLGDGLLTGASSTRLRALAPDPHGPTVRGRLLSRSSALAARCPGAPGRPPAPRPPTEVRRYCRRRGVGVRSGARPSSADRSDTHRSAAPKARTPRRCSPRRRRRRCSSRGRSRSRTARVPGRHRPAGFCREKDRRNSGAATTRSSCACPAWCAPGHRGVVRKTPRLRPKIGALGPKTACCCEG